MFPRIYEPPRLDVQFRQPPKRRGKFTLGALAAAAAAALALFYLWQYVVILELNYDAARVKRELDRANQDRGSLKADFYRRRSLAEVDHIAHDGLNMGAPGPGQIIIVEDTP